MNLRHPNLLLAALLTATFAVGHHEFLVSTPDHVLCPCQPLTAPPSEHQEENHAVSCLSSAMSMKQVRMAKQRFDGSRVVRYFADPALTHAFSEGVSTFYAYGRRTDSLILCLRQLRI